MRRRKGSLGRGRAQAPAFHPLLISGHGAAAVPEIYEVLARGGFHFTTKNVENANTKFGRPSSPPRHLAI